MPWEAFRDAELARRNLDFVAQALEQESDSQIIEAIGQQVVLSADPDRALNALERVLTAALRSGLPVREWLVDARWLERLVRVLACSEFLAKLLQRDPGLLALLQDVRESYPALHRTQQPDFLDLRARSRDLDEAEFMRLLREYRNAFMLQYVVRDLEQSESLEVLLADLSMLAEICLELCYWHAWDRLVERYGEPWYRDHDGQTHPATFAVVGLGKLGGNELNFSSDIDIMYLYDSSYEGQTSGGRRAPIETHEFFRQLSKALTHSMGEMTQDGMVFRVDLRLRPDGERGEICLGLAAYESYYGTIGQTWERSMLIKARPVAGSDALVEQFRQMVRPFVFRKYMGEGDVLSIRELKEKIDTKISKHSAVNVKLGRGGIREIEFFISILQLLYGGKDVRLRVHSTARALDVLRDQGYITAAEAEDLWKRYEFLRNVEHRIQFFEQRQTHSLPDEELCRQRIARLMGFADAEPFMQVLQEHMHAVNGYFSGLFPQEDRTGGAAVPREIFSGNYSRDELIPMLSAYPFENPRQAAANVYSIMERALRSDVERRRLRDVAATLLDTLASCSDPDQAFAVFERFYQAAARRAGVLEVIFSVPEALATFVRIFANSRYLSNIINKYPEMTDILLSEREILALPAATELQRRLDEQLQPLQDDPERFLDELRYFKQTEFLRIGYMELNGTLDVRSSTRALSQLADILVQAAWRWVSAQMEERYGIPQCDQRPCPFCIVALGKFGSAELNYSSDLDLIFLYGGGGTTSGGPLGQLRNNEYFVRLVQRLINALSAVTPSGQCYKVDARLRPNGEAGSLVTPLEGFVSYHRGSNVMTWERQMLLRRRYLCGDADLYAAFDEFCRNQVLQGFGPEQFREIYAMRRRIEHQKGRAPRGQHDYKAGSGGLVDLEFLCQCLQLSVAAEHSDILEGRTFDVLEQLEYLEVLAQEAARQVQANYLFYRRLENMLRIYQESTQSRIRLELSEAGPLAARMGFGNARDFVDHYGQVCSTTREVFDRYLSELSQT